MSFRKLFVCLALLMLSVSSAAAGSLSKPVGKPILTISGNITNKNTESGADFDRAMLENTGLQTIETATPWYETRMRFEGVPLDKLMELVGASGTKVTAVALNDYVTTIPIEDFKKFKVILAMKRNGNYMPVRDKGPLFIVYPYDSDPQLQTQTYYTRSAWQVAKLIIE
ncbi:molybdopterin-dependent oxidoreductase [Phyllobacterium sp. YR531]|uniref:molybdopterin-dependent oxidoreductase n=1 Tax=Phyllobacterium sp. YR531 TaxID=1144343 RepID=UPI00026F7DE5|nr:molybdopterin-dependent oxidoreductase [Phyllobacterium sp. YR531]EJN06310.1 hypothetical protein PMI41_00373 [Phyllobacterium sp. YR531]